MATNLAAEGGQKAHLEFADMRARLKAIFIGSIGILIEWYDFYAYAAFALYFAQAFLPNSDPVVAQLNAAILFAGDSWFGPWAAGSLAMSLTVMAAVIR